jgi:AP-1 complex subunit sigma 1/2
MSPSSSSPAAPACATSLNTRVRGHGPDQTSGTEQTDLYLADSKIVYRRYASLFFIAGADSTDNELITLEIIHRYVEQMDKYYGNVCELDIIFSFTKAYYILDELLLAGELQESSKKNVLRCISQQDALEDMEVRVL